jgi:REP element-mobilizing transposase RayT
MNRGWNHQTVFGDDADRRFFTRTVREYKAICGARIYHWAWMRSHFHMLVEVVFPNLRPFAGGIEQVYAQYHHRRYDTCGLFWQGRFKSKPVEAGEYLERCARYIERNPVRDLGIESAADYRWSSAAHYVFGYDDGVTDTNPHLILEPLGKGGRKHYARELDGVGEEDWMRQWQEKKVIGSREFAGRLWGSGARLRRRRGRPARYLQRRDVPRNGL